MKDLKNGVRLGNAIKFIRKARNMTAVDLAKQAGISQSYLSQLENNTRPRLASPDILVKISMGLSGGSTEMRACIYKLLSFLAGYAEPDSHAFRLIAEWLNVDLADFYSLVASAPIMFEMGASDNEIEETAREGYLMDPDKIPAKEYIPPITLNSDDLNKREIEFNGSLLNYREQIVLKHAFEIINEFRNPENHL
ncbi:helix-turn-helix domain-containing protein [Lactiplantibacillus plantarum]|uniref:helix-turn-helix domain-containing protein n=1 Tax=Lactiplantibacillus plantarum TaxID=1590 RepID=UPI0020435FDE|nr:helix-turn-helix transcriptional regulator [Lactiplantibacillus plantarum]MCM2626673.1 helix-turn-helix domain-containing protein [Lactiplantibacillus plantarum]